MELVMVKGSGGVLLPLDDAQAEKLRKFKTGSVIRSDFKEMRNGKFFKKWWSLIQLAYEMWTDGIEFTTFEGREVSPNFERFRKDITILAGHFNPVYAIDGSMTIEAESLQWSKMTEETFDSLYQATVTAILSKVLAHKNISREELDKSVEQIMRFA